MVKLVTVATHSDLYMPWLQKSCKRYNVELHILGWQQEWQGYGWKLKLLQDYLKTLHTNELVCCIDGYDVILVKPLDELEEYYENIVKVTKKKLIIGVDRIHNSIINFITKLIFKTCKDTQLNAGTVLGRANDWLQILNDMQKKYKSFENDQILYTDYCLRNKDVFYSDQDSVFFLTAQDPYTDILKNHDIKLLRDDSRSKYPILQYNGQEPFFVHGNGNTSLTNLIRQLGYKMSPEDEKKIHVINMKGGLGKFCHYSKLLFMRYIKYIFLVLLLLVGLYKMRKGGKTAKKGR